jgi:hypothetical protein
MSRVRENYRKPYEFGLSIKNIDSGYGCVNFLLTVFNYLFKYRLLSFFCEKGRQTLNPLSRIPRADMSKVVWQFPVRHCRFVSGGFPMRKGSLVFSAIILALITLASTPCRGQEYRATITGVVTDASKAVIPGASVSVRNLDTGEMLTAKTNAAGVYSVPYLHPGQKLEVSVEAAGFQKEAYPPIVLSISQVQTANFVLKVGAATQEVVVNSESYQVGLDTERADRGTIVDNKTITQMPLNGRNALSLMDLLPGVTNEGGAGNESSGMGVESTSYYTINGTPAQNTEYTIDGMPNNAVPWYLMNTPSVVPSIDALQEFKVTTSPYDAEEGRTGAGVVSMELKSGTNRLHGAAYEFAKRGFMDANSWYNNYFDQNRAAHTEDQYGFEVDGPVYLPHIYDGRNKTFFMFNFERFKEVLPTTLTFDTPNPAWLQGDFSGFVDNSGALMPVFNPYTATTSNTTRQIYQNNGQVNQVNPSTFNPIAVKLVNMIVAATPASTVALPNELPWERIWLDTIPNTANSTNYIVKFDQILGANDHLSGSYIHFYNPSFSPDTPANVPWYNGGTYTEYHINAGIDWVHTWRSNLLTDVHLSYQRYYDADGPTAANLSYDPTQLGIPASQLGPLKLGFPQVGFDVSQVTAANGNGYNNWIAMSRDFYNFPSDTYSLNPKITWNKNKHNLRAGLDMRFTHTVNTLQGDNTITYTSNGQATSEYWNQNDSNDIATAPDGTPLSQVGSGNAILDFLISQPNSVAVQNQVFPYYTWRYYAPWVQDDWKVTPTLTVNLGFRYDLNGPPTARHGWLNTGFDANAVNPISNLVTVPGRGELKGGLLFPGSSGTNTAWGRDYTKWQPRIGFAWQAKPGTVLRGGAGRTVLNSIDTPESYGFTNNPSFSNSSDGGRTYFSDNLTTPFPNGIPAIPGSSEGLSTYLGQGFYVVNPQFKLPSVINASLGLEQVMPADGKFEVSYVGTRGYGMTAFGGTHLYNPVIDANIPLYKSCNDALGLTDPSNPYPEGNCVNLTSNPFYGAPGVAGSLGSNQTTSLYQLARPYPEFTGITESLNNWGRTWYNSLQATYQQRLGWEQINGSWTWSKTMQGGGYLDYYYLVPIRSIAGTDRQNRVTVTSVLNIPVGRGLKYFSNMNRPVDAVAGGWELAADGFWETGMPVGLNTGFNPIGDIRSHQPKQSNPALIDEGVNPCAEIWHTPTPTTAGYFSYVERGVGVSSCSQPAWQQVAGTYGIHTAQLYTDQIRGPGASQIDVNLSKNFKFGEGFNLQLRMEEFNVLNHPTWYGGVDMTPTDANFGYVNKASNGQSNHPRFGQLGAKLTW